MSSSCHALAAAAVPADKIGKFACPGEPTGPFDDWLPRPRLAALLGVATDTLARWESRRTGPPCVRVGRHALYRIGAVRDWLLELETRRRRP